MSVDTRPDVILGTAAPAAPTRRSRQVLVGLLLVVLFGLLVWQTWPDRPDIPYDPESVGPQGTKALAQVLAREGVDVEIVHDRDQLSGTRLDTGTTLVVSPTPMLSDAGLRAVRDRIPEAGRVVLLGLPDDALWALDLPIETTGGPGGSVALRCSHPLLTGRGAVERVGPVEVGYRRMAGPWIPWSEPSDGSASSDGSDGSDPYGDPGQELGTSWPGLSTTGCLSVGGGASALLTVSSEEDPDVDLLAPVSTLTNREITNHDDAALGLRLLGSLPRVVWYSPDSEDVQAGDEPVTTTRVAPDWLQPLVVLLLGAVGLTMWWRGRRLGRLAVEPLPVTVHAAETTIARGRLYRAARGHAHAAEALRAATRRRLAKRLGLPPGSPADAVVAAVADASGRPRDDVENLLAGPAPATDAQLAQVAQDLAALEEGIRR